MEVTFMYIRLIVLLFHSVPCISQLQIPNLPDKQYVQPGDVNLGGIFPISNYHKYLPCGDKLRSPAIMQYVEAMVFAVEKVNNDTEILPNVTLGFAILDDCKKPTTAMSQALRFVPRPLDARPCFRNLTNFSSNSSELTEYFDVVGVVGSMTSSASMSVADTLGIFHLPQISYSSTSDLLGDRAKYPYFLRVVAPDNYQIRSIVDLIKSFNWTYISTVHSAGSYGESGIKTLKQLTSTAGICIGVSRFTEHTFTDDDYDDVMRDIIGHPEAKAVVIFTGPEYARGLLAAAQRQGAIGKFVWIGGDAWATRLDTFGDTKAAALGAFTVKMYSHNSPNFDQYFKGLTPLNRVGNPWFVQFWEQQFQCSLNHTSDGTLCNSSYSLRNAVYSPLSSISPVIDAVQTFAIALNKLLDDLCPGVLMGQAEARDCINGPTVLEYLKNVSYEGQSGAVKFDEDGEFLGRYMIEQVQMIGDAITQRHVATWDARSERITFEPHGVRWYLSEQHGGLPESVCSKPCSPGEFVIPTELPCCWECRKCRINEITTNNASSCTRCPKFTWPEQTTFASCQNIEPTILKWREAESLLILALAGFGMLGTVAIFVFFVTHNQTRLIKASSRELCYFMLTGIFLGYLTVFGLVAPPPGSVICVMVHFGFTLGCTGIYAPLLTRTNRIYRIFNAGKKSTKIPPLAGWKAQLVIATSLISVQVAMNLVTTVLLKPRPVLTMAVETERFVEMSCEHPVQGLLAFLVYNLLLVLLCAAFAFKTRKLPDNFNESRFISMCVYTTLVVWIAFIPTYFTTAKEYHRTILLSLALIVNATVALAFFFLPKVYATLYLSDACAGSSVRGAGTLTGTTGLPSVNTISVSPRVDLADDNSGRE